MKEAARIAGVTLAIGAIAVLSFAAVRQHRANQGLREENIALQTRARRQAGEIEQLEHLRSENQQLAKLKADAEELERLRNERQELLRLRGEVALLRQDKTELDRLKAARALPRSASRGTVPGTPRVFAGAPAPLGGLTAAAPEPQGDVPLDPQVAAEYLRRISAPANPVSWSPGQAAGAPDTHQAGDIRTAWAAQSPDGGAEWLRLEYEQPTDIAQVRVRETHNPGAVTAITAVLQNGAEVTLWQGEEPQAEAPVEMEFNVPGGVIAQTVTVHLDTKKAPGWNEIDAVELVGRDGSRQWARTATASSYFGENRERRALPTPPAAPQNQ